MDYQSQKQQLRSKIALQKKSYSPELLFLHSQTIIRRLESLPLFHKASCVALYHALPGEVQTAELIEKWYPHKTILLPAIEGNDIRFYSYQGKEQLENGLYGISEPCRNGLCPPLQSIDLAIIPGVAFDRNLNRMGRGKGYYDRFLTNLTAPKIGLCFDFQLLDTIPTQPFDKKMDLIISEKGIINRQH
ncbi:MAG: 5-formyltetrahydrofolate cyclo-ligase [Tannerellaceae bacterium]|nr:5-formyltetrahydrofolate cyclo-ligase [Tannerellaceae bacterium]